MKTVLFVCGEGQFDGFFGLGFLWVRFFVSCLSLFEQGLFAWLFQGLGFFFF